MKRVKLGLAVLLIDLSMSALAQAQDRLNKPLGEYKWLVHLTETGTLGGPVKKDGYMLWRERPDRNGILHTTGQDGTDYTNKAELVGGPFRTLLEACAAVVGRPKALQDLGCPIPVQGRPGEPTGVKINPQRPEVTLLPAKAIACAVWSDDPTLTDAQVILPNGRAIDLTPGTELYEGMRIRTGYGTRAKICFPNGTIVIFEELTEVKLDTFLWADPRQVVLWLKAGAAAAEVKREAAVRTRFEVRAPSQTTSVRGTQFIVTVHDQVSEVLVYEGEVEVTNNRTKRKIMVGAGYKVTASASEMSSPARLTTSDQARWTTQPPGAKPSERSSETSSSGASRRLETLTVPATNHNGAVTAPLDPTHSYRITVSGAISAHAGVSAECDALYCFHDGVKGPMANLRVNREGQSILQLGTKPTGMLPYNPGHTYQVVIVGVSGPLHFFFTDSDYSDNSGAWKVTIQDLGATVVRASPATATPSGSFTLVAESRNGDVT